MPRYFFNIDDSVREEDDVGTVLENDDAARMQAVIFAADFLRDDPALVWNDERLMIEVTDNEKHPLMQVTITAQVLGAPRTIYDGAKPRNI